MSKRLEVLNKVLDAARVDLDRTYDSVLAKTMASTSDFHTIDSAEWLVKKIEQEIEGETVNG